MLVNATTLTAVFVNLRTDFNRAFDGAETQWTQTAMLVPSSGKQNDYPWFSRFPKMRKWIDEKVVKALEAYQYSIVNDDWEATIEVDRNDIEDDQLGVFGPMAMEYGYSAAMFPDEIVSTLKNDAFSALCFDGQYYYDTDHSVAGANVSNKGTAALSAASLAAAVASYGAGRTAIMGFKDIEGRPLGLVPDLLEVPPALEATGRILTGEDKFTDNGPNPYRGTAKLLVNPRLTSATAWFLHVTSRPIKPFIFQQRKAPTFVQQTDQNNDNVFMRRKFRFGAEARAAGGYGFWQLSYGSTGAS